MHKGWLAVAAMLLAGCAQDPPSADVATFETAAAQAAATTEQVPIRFAVGDSEATAAFEATFQPTDTCMPQCQGAAVQDFDLTPIVPAEAPVELTVTVDGDGVFAQLVYQDAEPVQSSDGDEDGNGGSQGGGQQLSALVVRGESGTVGLRLFHTFSFPPEATTATIEARSVVRAGALVPLIPATLRLSPGDELNLTGRDIDQLVVIRPDGAFDRITVRPFVYQVDANASAGEYTLILDGDEPSPVLGPNVTMAARRIAFTEEGPHALTPGQKASWSLSIDQTPLLVGVGIRSGPPAAAFVSASHLGAWQMSLTSPANVELFSEASECGQPPFPFCQPPFLFNQYSYALASDFLGEHLVAGQYTATASIDQGQNVEAFAFYLTIA